MRQIGKSLKELIKRELNEQEENAKVEKIEKVASQLNREKDKLKSFRKLKRI